MFYSGRSKQMPYFSDYVTSCVEERRGMALRTFRWAGLRWGVPMIAGGVMMMFTRLPLLAFMLLSAGILALYAYPELARARGDRERRSQKDTLDRLHQLLLDRKLHRALEPALMDVLEAGARSWHEATSRLNSQVWQSGTRGGHWDNLRRQLGAALDLAMEELCAIAANSLRPVPSSSSLQELVDDVAEAIKPSPVVWTPDMERARQLVDKLAQAAAEIDRATKDIQPGVQDALDPNIALDVCLGELKTLRDAERELQQES